LLSLPGHQSIFYINFPAAGTGAVNSMGRAYDLVMLPALSITILPAARFFVDLAMAIRELALFLFEKL
jgi:hypothetical protein